MFGNLTGWHLLILLALILLIFGGTKLPGLARSVGQSMRIFRSEVKTMKDENGDPATTTNEADGAADGSSSIVTPAASTPEVVRPMATRPGRPPRPERGRWRKTDGSRMPLAAHLRELRRRLTRAAAAILVGAVAGYFLAPFVLDGLRGPISQLSHQRDAGIIYTTVTGAFDLRMSVAITIGVVISSPFWLYQIFAFLVPGLTGREKRFTFGFFFSAVPLFFAGAVSGWFLFPHMVQLLASFASQQDATYLDARGYYDFVLKLVVAVGVAFVLPVFLVLLNFAGVLSARAIIKSWRWAILVICIFAALATPSADVMSMFLLIVPMVALYLTAALIAHLHDRRAAKRFSELYDEKPNTTVSQSSTSAI